MPSRPAPLAPGNLVTGRYRLLRQVGSASSTLWEAQDDVLARPVAIRSLPTDPATDGVLDAARRAGVVPHRTLTRAYDVVDEPELRLIVREWVVGEPLDAVVAEAPLSPDRAMLIIGAVADALASAAEFGVHHGRLHPGHILITPDGDIRVTDAATAAALVGAPAGDDSDDVRALGCLLYFALTGRWPAQDRPELPPAPTEDGRLCSPRQVRAGVPRDLDRLAMDCLQQGPATPSSAADVVTRLTALHRGADTTRHIPAVVDEPAATITRPSRWPVYLAGGLAVLLLAYLGLVALTGGSGSGVPFPDLLHHNGTTAATTSTHPAKATTTEPPPTTPIALTHADSFDPLGDGSENQSEAANAIDNNPATAWYTETYSTRPDFGGLKKGVGLMLDAGSPVTPRQVEADFVATGATFQVRAGDAAGGKLEDYTLEGNGDAATNADVKVAISDTTPHRYWLIWLTKLPPISGGFKAGIATAALSR